MSTSELEHIPTETRAECSHTPGPWITRGPRRVDQGDDYAIVAGGEIIAEAFGRTSQNNFPPSAANARLIAAAPDLLAALKEVVALSDRKHDAWDAARAAIAKAEGRS